MSANTKAKSAAKKGERNPVRRNGKAWKKRECGFRHAPTDSCRNCLTLKDAARAASTARQTAIRRRKAAATAV